MARPSNFSWSTAKVAGVLYDYPVTAAEWSGLQSSIVSFRVYTGLAAHAYTTPTQFASFFASMFNEARNGIADMSPPVSPPSSVASNDFVTAAGLNGLVDSLNSIP